MLTIQRLWPLAAWSIFALSAACGSTRREPFGSDTSAAGAGTDPEYGTADGGSTDGGATDGEPTKAGTLDADCAGGAPWIVYLADDPTNEQPALHAVKRGSSCQVKLSRELEAGARITTPQWAAAPQLFSYVVEATSGVSTTELVYFGDGTPRRIGSVPGSELRWSESGRRFASCSAAGVSVYDYAGRGEVARVFHWPTADERCTQVEWSQAADEFVYATRTTEPDLYRVYTTSHALRDWSVSLLLDTVRLSSLSLSPTDPEMVYTLGSAAATPSPLYIMPLRPGLSPRLIAQTGGGTVQWSPDRSRYLFLERQWAGQLRGYLSNGSIYSGDPSKLPLPPALSGAVFAPGGERVLFSEPFESWGQSVSSFDPETNTSRPVTRMRVDERLLFRADSDLIIAPQRSSAQGLVTLTALRSEGSQTLDVLAGNETLKLLELSAGGRLVSYLKGDAARPQGYYADTRIPFRPLRLPGEGWVNLATFDALGASLYYIREQESGASACWYLDVSGAVASLPVKISREEHVRHCLPQP